MEMQATSGEFNADLFAMANNTDFASGTVKTPHSLETAVGTDKKVEITSAASIKDSIIINGMTVGEAAADGVYAVTETGDAGAYTTTITFNNEMDNVEITYFTEDEGDVIEVSNSEAAMGELIAKWPVYANGTEVAAAGVKGYVLMDVFKCRVTQMPGFDTSYKSAATNAVTFSTMDARRDDGNVYSIAYIEKK